MEKTKQTFFETNRKTEKTEQIIFSNQKEKGEGRRGKGRVMGEV
jgi:hypothetical protein